YGTGYTNATSTDSSDYTLLKRHDNTFDWDTLGTELLSNNQIIGGTKIKTVRTGLTTFSDYSQGGGAGSLPITLVSFDAKAAGNAVKLTWVTGNEINNDFF